MSVTEATEERFDPDSTAVRSEQRVVESHDGSTPSTGGLVGARGNVPGPDGKPQGATTTTVARQRGNKEKVVTNYEVSKSTRHTTSAPVEVKRLTVAVLVDKGALEAGTTDVTPERLKDVVKRMVGFSAARGDEIDVMVAPFKTSEQEEEESVPFYAAPWFWKILQYAVWLILGTLIFVFMVLPGVRAAKKLPTIQIWAKPVAELEAAIGDGKEDKTGGEGKAEEKSEEGDQAGGLALSNRDRVLAYISDNTDQATEVLRAWLQEQEAE